LERKKEKKLGEQIQSIENRLRFSYENACPLDFKTSSKLKGESLRCIINEIKLRIQPFSGEQKRNLQEFEKS
jgi:hypothetical protein